MIIYKTTNLINGKIYVGRSIHDDSKYLGSGVYIMHALNKYGKHNFKKEILQHVNCMTALIMYERLWIKKLNCRNSKIGYNINDGDKFDLTGHADIETILYNRRFTRYTVVVHGTNFKNAAYAAKRLNIDFEDFKTKLLDENVTYINFQNPAYRITIDEKRQRKINIKLRKQQEEERRKIINDCKIAEAEARRSICQNKHNERMLRKSIKIRNDLRYIIDKIKNKQTLLNDIQIEENLRLFYEFRHFHNHIKFTIK